MFFWRAGAIFPMVITSQPRAMIQIESNDTTASLSKSETEVCVARIPLAPSRDLDDLSSQKIHVEIWESTKLQHNRYEFLLWSFPVRRVFAWLG